MARLAALTGTARPRPWPRPGPTTAVFTPTTAPELVARAPPELPGWREASVWITFSTSRPWAPDRAGMDRPSALTTPALTEPPNPRGLPTATTSWPTRKESASPRTAGPRPSPAARMTAKSERRSAPTTSKASSLPSASVAMPPADPSTTWAEVRRKPSAVITTADPLP